jgi:hypothetical protein
MDINKHTSQQFHEHMRKAIDIIRFLKWGWDLDLYFQEKYKAKKLQLTGIYKSIAELAPDFAGLSVLAQYID